MKTGIFPHPILLPEGTDYKELRFDMDVKGKPQHTLDNNILVVMRFVLESKFIKNLLRNKKAKLSVMVRCAKTYHRKIIVTDVLDDNLKFELKLPVSEYVDKITLTPYIAAMEPIEGFKSGEHHDEFNEISIDVPAGAILARGSNLDVKIDSLQTLSAAIRFTPDTRLKDGEYDVDVSDDYIDISMNPQTRSKIEALRRSNNRKLYPSIYMVALTHAIQNVTPDGIRTWEEALRKTLVGYKIKIDPEELKHKGYRYAQTLLKYPLNSLTEGIDVD